MPRRYPLRLSFWALLFLLLASGRLRAQDPTPGGPFQTMHLLWIDLQQPNAEKAVESAVAGLNRAITQAGCAECTYHLWKVVDGAPGSYNYIQTSSWPSGLVYTKIHDSPAYREASRNWLKLRAVVTREAYDRLVEVPLGNSDARAALADPAAPAVSLPSLSSPR